MLYVDCVFVCKDMFFFEMSPFFYSHCDILCIFAF